MNRKRSDLNHIFEINDETLQDPLLKWALENPEGTVKDIPKDKKSEIFQGRTKRQAERDLLLIRNWGRLRPVQFVQVKDLILYGKEEEPVEPELVPAAS